MSIHPHDDFGREEANSLHTEVGAELAQAQDCNPGVTGSEGPESGFEQLSPSAEQSTAVTLGFDWQRGAVIGMLATLPFSMLMFAFVRSAYDGNYSANPILLLPAIVVFIAGMLWTGRHSAGVERVISFLIPFALLGLLGGVLAFLSVPDRFRSQSIWIIPVGVGVATFLALYAITVGWFWGNFYKRRDLSFAQSLTPNGWGYGLAGLIVGGLIGAAGILLVDRGDFQFLFDGALFYSLNFGLVGLLFGSFIHYRRIYILVPIMATIALSAAEGTIGIVIGSLSGVSFFNPVLVLPPSPPEMAATVVFTWLYAAFISASRQITERKERVVQFSILGGIFGGGMAAILAGYLGYAVFFKLLPSIDLVTDSVLLIGLEYALKFTVLGAVIGYARPSDVLQRRFHPAIAYICALFFVFLTPLPLTQSFVTVYFFGLSVGFGAFTIFLGSAILLGIVFVTRSVQPIPSSSTEPKQPMTTADKVAVASGVLAGVGLLLSLIRAFSGQRTRTTRWDDPSYTSYEGSTLQPLRNLQAEERQAQAQKKRVPANQPASPSTPVVTPLPEDQLQRPTRRTVSAYDDAWPSRDPEIRRKQLDEAQFDSDRRKAQE